ncbi:hypothetical protein H0A36_06130 [Endozoicomonas sp. SM1973]|uniref:Zinc resistance-associated protein n=1 Tax=Spartinivicinus marinus TaxID=2994442 RepID=A0A853HWF4_9GAMM|nr:Spy/CpxP family protein refolding chaperone [Spartinivicinus marinus]MCX4028248.1 Spy/CpxP family protein refolding chaperone [Spartinivicinus marinus]NYZ65583.1 hypothetical protein [Spartinivicinus marinus]
MNKLRYGLVAMALTLPLAFNSLAWSEPHPGQHKGPKIAKELSLTAEQKEAFKSIMSNQRKQRCAIHEKYRPQIQAEMEQIHQSTISQLSSVLSAEQIDKFQQFHEKRKERRQQHKKRFNCEQGSGFKGRHSGRGENAGL